MRCHGLRAVNYIIIETCIRVKYVNARRHDKGCFSTVVERVRGGGERLAHAPRIRKPRDIIAAPNGT